MPGQWHSLLLSAIDSVEALALPAGTVAFAGIDLGANPLLVDDGEVWIAGAAALLPETDEAYTPLLAGDPQSCYATQVVETLWMEPSDPSGNVQFTCLCLH